MHIERKKIESNERMFLKSQKDGDVFFKISKNPFVNHRVPENCCKVFKNSKRFPTEVSKVLKNLKLY